MADKKISQLTGATTPLAGTEVLPIVQSGNTVKVAVSNLTAGRTVDAAQLNVDNLQLDGNTLSSTNTNGDINISPNGTGKTLIGNPPFSSSVLNTTKSLSIYEEAVNSSSTVLEMFSRFSDGQRGYTYFQNVSPASGYGDLKVFNRVNFVNTEVAKFNQYGIAFPAGKGIDFSANTGAAGETSALLNWYEEGTWTPAVRGAATAGTYELAAAEGQYVRIGSQVTIWCRIVAASVVTGGGSGYLQITGAPFANAFAAIGAVYAAGVDMTNNYTWMVAAPIAASGTTTWYLEECGDAQVPSDFPISGFGANDIIKFCATYRV